MKRILILSFFIALSLTSAKAQFSNELILGMNASQIWGDNLVGFHQAGLNVGVSSVFKVKDRWNGRIELTYSQKGSRRPVDPDNPSAQQRFSIRLNYFEIPLLAEYALSKNFQLVGGPSIGYLLGAKVVEGLREEEQRDAYFRYDFSFMGGFNYRVTDKLFASLRFNDSLVNINKGSTISNRGFYNISTSFTMRFLIRGNPRG